MLMIEHSKSPCACQHKIYVCRHDVDKVFCVDISATLAYLHLMTQDAILHMRIPEDTKRLLDVLRKGEPDLPSKSEMVRRLIERSFEARKEAKRK